VTEKNGANAHGQHRVKKEMESVMKRGEELASVLVRLIPEGVDMWDSVVETLPVAIESPLHLMIKI
jgi:hypothetical protein